MQIDEVDWIKSKLKLSGSVGSEFGRSARSDGSAIPAVEYRERRRRGGTEDAPFCLQLLCRSVSIRLDRKGKTLTNPWRHHSSAK